MISLHWSGQFFVAVLAATTGYAQLTPTNPPAPATPFHAPALSPAVAEVVRLVEAGIGESVTVAFIQDSHTHYNLTADKILYLKDLGLTVPMLTAMLDQDRAYRGPTPGYFQPTPTLSTTPISPAVPPAEEGDGPFAYVTDAPAEVGYFYPGLAPYGTWAVLPGLGWCWQPRAVVMNPHWRPYCDGGHWVYTDAGWFWQSDYSWGWAPFHFGRWRLDDRSGWVWVPDAKWGPAWVTWRTAGSICGWAPLPPGATFTPRDGYHFEGSSVPLSCDFKLHSEEFTFVDLKGFLLRDLSHACLPPDAARQVFNQAIVINNFVAGTNSVINHGLPATNVGAAVHAAIRPVPIHDLATPPDRNAALATVTAETARGIVSRRYLTLPDRSSSYRAQRVDEQNPLIRHAAIVPPSAVKWDSIPHGAEASEVAPGTLTPRVPSRAEFGQIARVSESRRPEPADVPGATATELPKPRPINVPGLLPVNPRIYYPRTFHRLPESRTSSTANPAQNPLETPPRHP